VIAVKGIKIILLMLCGMFVIAVGFAQQQQPPATTNPPEDEDAQLVSQLVQQAVQIGETPNPEDKAVLYTQIADAMVGRMEKQVAQGKYNAIPNLSKAHIDAMNAAQKHVDAAMQQKRDPSKGLEAVNRSADTQIPVLTAMQGRVPPAMQPRVAQSLQVANHGQMVSSHRLAAIQAWKASGQKGPPPWAGVGGGPGGNPNYPGQGRDIGRGHGGPPGQVGRGGPPGRRPGR
jgi:hypothetical protein